MSETNRVLIAEPDLRATCEGLLTALGVSAEDAAQTAAVFLQAELMGEESHGMRLFLHVLGRVKAGGDRRETNITTISDRGAVAVLDANRSLGQVAAARAMRLAIRKAREHGIGFVGVRNSNSYTSAKYYSLMAVDEGMIGITYTNTSRKVMPPEGGRTPVLGNNPMAIAAPAGEYPPFVLDMACTAAAVERVLQAREGGEKIPLGWALDPDGNPTTDPEMAFLSGVLLPFGGYKAFGLGMANEILTSVLFGGLTRAGKSTGFLPYDGPMNTSYSFQAIDIECFMPLDEFRARMDEVIRAVKSSTPRPGVEGIVVAGERSFKESLKRRREGIPVSERVIREIDEWAGELGVMTLATG